MQDLQIAFFTEAGTTKGMGHLVRTYTFATYLKKLEYSVEFYLESDIDYSEKFETIDFKWNDFDMKLFYDVIVIDSYVASLDFYKIAFEHSKVLICIDDYRRLEYPMNSIIINFAPNAENIYYSDKKDLPNYLLGTRYLFFRDTIIEAKKMENKHIFIMFGGNDISSLSQKTLALLEDIPFPKVLVTTNKTLFSKIQAQYRDTEILYKPNDSVLAAYMANSIVAITTASMTVYELAYLKIPILVTAISLDQEKGQKILIEHDIVLQSISIDSTLYSIVKKIVFNPPRVNNMIDSDGCKRVYTFIKERLKL